MRTSMRTSINLGTRSSATDAYVGEIVVKNSSRSDQRYISHAA